VWKGLRDEVDTAGERLGGMGGRSGGQRWLKVANKREEWKWNGGNDGSDQPSDEETTRAAR
jgi:hypothetical protein